MCDLTEFRIDRFLPKLIPSKQCRVELQGKYEPAVIDVAALAVEVTDAGRYDNPTADYCV